MSSKIKKFIGLTVSTVMLAAAIPMTSMANGGYSITGNIENGVLNAEITDTADNKDITAYIAEYDSDGMLVKLTLDKEARRGTEIKNHGLDKKTNTVKIFLWEDGNMRPVIGTVKMTIIPKETEAPTATPTTTPTADPDMEYTTDVIIRFTDEEGNQIKSDVTVQTDKTFRTGDTYTVPAEYQKDILIKPGADGGMYTYYAFNAGTSDLEAELTPETTILTLRFNGEQYDYYEDFEDYTLNTNDTSIWAHGANDTLRPTLETDNTKYIKHSTTKSSNGSHMKLDKEINAENKTVKISADVKFTETEVSGGGLGEFTISNTNPKFSSNKIEYGVDSSCAGHILYLGYNAKNRTFDINGENVDLGFIGDWMHIEADADFGQKKVSVKLTNTAGKSWEGTKTFFSGEFNVDNNIGSVYMRSPSVNGTVSVDNITVKVTGEATAAEPNIKSPLNYKSVYAFGDSIVYGHTAPAQSFMRLIANDYAMKLNMMAKNGATIMPGSNQILTQINNAPAASPDFVVFEGYTNDAYGSAASDPEFNPSGSQRDVTACYGTIDPLEFNNFDTSTFCGSFENTIKTMKDKWGDDTKYVFVTIHKSGARNFEIQTKLRELSVEMCEKWGIAVVDMFEDSALDTRDPSQMSKYMIGGKGSHPNVTACKEFYIPAVTGVMEGLCSD
ncbi:MAG: SGNH/GDSL hydrolase family protein [Oscillospiraceae bacterium]|nr:SGNH/GDSL hydrolase family protein [Oscillospiraceae bacterium]